MLDNFKLIAIDVDEVHIMRKRERRCSTWKLIAIENMLLSIVTSLTDLVYYKNKEKRRGDKTLQTKYIQRRKDYGNLFLIEKENILLLITKKIGRS